MSLVSPCVQVQMCACMHSYAFSYERVHACYIYIRVCGGGRYLRTALQFLLCVHAHARVCVCVCTCSGTDACLATDAFNRMHARAYFFLRECIYVYMYIYICTYIYICLCLYSCVCVCLGVSVYVCDCVRMGMHMYVDTGANVFVINMYVRTYVRVYVCMYVYDMYVCPTSRHAPHLLYARRYLRTPIHIPKRGNTWSHGNT